MVLCGETQSMLLLCLCSCEPECVWGREAECGCVTETKIIFVCVLRVTQGWRVQLMSLSRCGHITQGWALITPLPPPFQSHSCPGGCKPRWGQKREGGQREPQPPPTIRLCHVQAEQGYPCSPSWSTPSFTVVVVPGLGGGPQAEHQDSGDTSEGPGVSCRRGCWAGGGLTIPSTGCIIKKSLQAGGQSRV